MPTFGGPNTGSLNPNPQWPFWIGHPQPAVDVSVPVTNPDFEAWWPQHRRTQRVALARRGRFYDPPYTATVCVAPAPRRKFVATARRGRFYTTPQSVPLVDLRRTVARRLPKVSRGRMWEAAQGSFAPPSILSRKTRKPVLRPKRVLDPPWTVQQVVAAPAYPPQSIRVRVKPALLRRGKLAEPAWAQQAQAPIPVYPYQVIRSRTKPALRHRLTQGYVPREQATPIQQLRIKARVAVVPRRSMALIPPSLSLSLPQIIRRRGRFGTSRRAKLAQPPWAQAAFVGQTSLGAGLPTFVIGVIRVTGVLAPFARTTRVIGISRLTYGRVDLRVTRVTGDLRRTYGRVDTRLTRGIVISRMTRAVK